jgi:hypothetical protein
MKQHESWKEMTPAERLVQSRTVFTWAWMNEFTEEAIRLALLSLANEVLRLRRKNPSVPDSKAKPTNKPKEK